jgi:hypothetical protein
MIQLQEHLLLIETLTLVLYKLGDKYHACATSEDLRPSEGSECEKRLVKTLDGVNSLYVR